MNLKYIKISFPIFIISYLLICSFLSFFIYKVLITDFVELQSEQNEKNIQILLNKVDTEITNIYNITTDYSKWDDTYEYMENKNEEFLFDNFREGSNTLIDLGLNFVILANLENNIYYSKIEKNEENISNKFIKELINKFKNKNKVGSLFRYENKLIYLEKQEILKSDFTGKPNGYMIFGKFLNNDDLYEYGNIFDNLSISYVDNKTLKEELKLVNNTSIYVHSEFLDNNIRNTIDFYDDNNNYTFSLHGNNKTLIIKKGKKTIFILSFLISCILFILLYVLYKNQRIMQRYNNILEKKVLKRTKQLEKTLRNLKQKNRKLHIISNTDVLTKTRNRRSFFQDSKKALKYAIDNHEELCLLIMDIDHFKSINDTYGHAIGDEVLRNFSKLINELLDDSMIFGRIGGEEFCITFQNKSFKESTIIAEKIRKKIENFVLEINNEKIRFTLSLGLASRKEYKHIDEIVQNADELLYKAKNEGRNRLVREKIR